MIFRSGEFSFNLGVCSGSLSESARRGDGVGVDDPLYRRGDARSGGRGSPRKVDLVVDM